MDRQYSILEQGEIVEQCLAYDCFKDFLELLSGRLTELERQYIEFEGDKMTDAQENKVRARMRGSIKELKRVIGLPLEIKRQSQAEKEQLEKKKSNGQTQDLKRS